MTRKFCRMKKPHLTQMYGTVSRQRTRSKRHGFLINSSSSSFPSKVHIHHRRLIATATNIGQQKNITMQQQQQSKGGFLVLSHTRPRGDGIIDVENAGGNPSKRAKYYQRELLNGKLADFSRYVQSPPSWSLSTTPWTLDDSSSVGTHTSLSSTESLGSEEEWIEHLACLAADCPEDTGTSESSLLSVMAQPETVPSPSSFRNIIGANKRRERTKSSSAALLCYPPGLLVPPSVKNSSQKDTVKLNHADFYGEVDEMRQNIKSVSPPPGISRQLSTSSTTVLPKLAEETMTLVCLTSFPFRIMNVNNEFDRATRRRKDLIGKTFLDLFVPSNYGGNPVSIVSCDTLLGVFQNDIVQIIANGSQDDKANHHDILYCSIDVQPTYCDSPSQLTQACSRSNSDGDSRILQNFIVTLHPIHKTNSLDTELDEKASTIVYLPMPEGLLRSPGAK